MFSAVSVCLFVCSHDNFRTIKRTMMKLGIRCICTKISEVKMLRSKSLGTKNEQAAFCSGVVLWGVVLFHYR